MLKKNIIVIPARGNSKRLPNKNTTLFGDIPLTAHSIQYAKVNGFDNIVVSTDDNAIKNIARSYGVKVIDRPSNLATDESPTIDTLKHVLINSDKKFETVILLQPTNPLRPKGLLKEAYQKFIERGYDSLFTVTRNYHKLGNICNEKFVPLNYKIGQRSQDLEPLYFENGLLYITKASLILEGKIVGENNYPFIVNHPYAKIDIDTKEDFEYAEYLLKRSKK